MLESSLRGLQTEAGVLKSKRNMLERYKEEIKTEVEKTTVKDNIDVILIESQFMDKKKEVVVAYSRRELMQS